MGPDLAGKPVISPAELFTHPPAAPVIVSSYTSENAIVPALRDGGMAADRIIPLYAAALAEHRPARSAVLMPPPSMAH